MQLQGLCFSALIPSPGFRWIYRAEDGTWESRQPPEDWPEQDYQAAIFYQADQPKPDLTDRFYLAASMDECVRAHAEQKTEFGKTLCKPDLYLRFASARATPTTILEFANRFGLLHYDKSGLTVRRSNAMKLMPEFRFDLHEPKSKTLAFRAEKASDWLGAFEGVRYNLRAWLELEAKGGYSAMNSYLEDGFNYSMQGSLTYQAKMDPATGETWSEVIAASLADLLDIQWGMSVAAQVLHRQCSECPAWFAIHPGAGRPEKQFCSDACRMRAYRRRRNSRKRHG